MWQNMIEKDTNNYKKCVVSVFCNTRSGTGFFIAPNLLCTCWHVIANNNPSDITVLWQGRGLRIDDISYYEDFDIAFMKIDGAQNDQWIIPRPKYILENGEEYRAFGFAEGYEDVGSPLLLTFTGTDCLQDVLTFSNDNVTYGYSGSPIVNENGQLVGMLGISRDINNPSGGRGISVDCILKCLCGDKNFYIFALLLLQNRGSAQIEDDLLVRNNKYIEKAVEKYLRFLFKQAPNNASNAILYPYLSLFYGEQVYDDSENIYIYIGRLCFKKYENISELFIKWLHENKDSFDKIKIQKAIAFVKTKIIPLPQKSVIKIERLCDQLKSARIAGSSCMKLSELFTKNGKLKVPFHWKSDDIKSKKLSIEMAIINRIIQDDNILVLANPGIGKSTLAKSLFFELVKQRISNSNLLIPLYIDLNRELSKGEKKFDITWFNSILSVQYGKLESAYTGSLFENIVLILDGLDEYLDGLSKDEMTFFLLTDIFNLSYKFKIVITCREQFYIRSSVRFCAPVNSFSKVTILPWKKEDKLKYIKRYLNLLKRKKVLSKNSKNEIVLRRISESPFLREVTNTPLYLNMTLEVLGNDENKKINNIVDLYEQYSYDWISNELCRIHGDNVINEKLFSNPSIIMNLLAVISWRYHDFAFAGRFEKTSRIYFSYREIELCLEEAQNEMGMYTNLSMSIDKVAKFIAEHTFFITDTSAYLYFVHKSFYEYFTAKFIFDLLSSPKASITTVVKAHANLFGPEVSELVKEHIKRIDNFRNKQHCFLNNCIKALEILDGCNELLELDEPKRRIAKQQIIYHMGLIKLNEAVVYLKKILEKETDLWIRRGIIIGLSFSGDETELNHYIERMKDELKSQQPWKENEVNIGFSLSFFGDQPYDNYAPEIDQNLPHCRNTVERLVYQLSTYIDRPSWRSNLYTLIYLYRYRTISLQEYLETIVKLKPEIYQILEKLEKTYKLLWPEISEMRTILDSL